MCTRTGRASPGPSTRDGSAEHSTPAQTIPICPVPSTAIDGSFPPALSDFLAMPAA
jgi:hypothetical protein